GQNMLHDGLAEQRMYEISRPRPQTVPAEQLTIRQTKDLATLARRKIVALLQPGVASAIARNGTPGRQRQPCDCPCRMPRPSTDFGPVGRFKSLPAPPPSAIDSHAGVGRLEED